MMVIAKAVKAVWRLMTSKLSPESRMGIAELPQIVSIRRWCAEKSSDVFLISFPKCGRTWLRLMIGRALEKHFNLANADILELHQLGTLHPDIPKILVSHDDGPQWKRPDELVESKKKYKKKKVIFLVRDPRDVLVSSYFQKKKRRNAYDGEMSDYVYEEVGSLKTLLQFYNIWAENRHIPKDFLLVRYEDIQTNPPRELRRVLDFLDLRTISDDVIAEAVRFASFDNMRKMEKEGRFRSPKLRPVDSRDKESYKTRQGKVGGFVEYLSKEEIEYINRKMDQMLSSFYGYRP